MASKTSTASLEATEMLPHSAESACATAELSQACQLSVSSSLALDFRLYTNNYSALYVPPHFVAGKTVEPGQLNWGTMDDEGAS